MFLHAYLWIWEGRDMNDKVQLNIFICGVNNQLKWGGAAHPALPSACFGQLLATGCHQCPGVSAESTPPQPSLSNLGLLDPGRSACCRSRIASLRLISNAVFCQNIKRMNMFILANVGPGYRSTSDSSVIVSSKLTVAGSRGVKLPLMQR